jgi:hypothetical protein
VGSIPGGSGCCGTGPIEHASPCRAGRQPVPVSHTQPCRTVPRAGRRGTADCGLHSRPWVPHLGGVGMISVVTFTLTMERCGFLSLLPGRGGEDTTNRNSPLAMPAN